MEGNSLNITKNTIFNLLGYLIPMLLAVIFIPYIIKGLGTERFGILNLVWILIGYFSFFDLGIGRALTKIISEKLGVKSVSEIPDFFWTSFFLILLISSIISLILFLFIPNTIFKFLKISEELHNETLFTFYILILSIPIVATSACLRGFLEAYQRFDIINIVRVGFGVSTFLTPVLILFFCNNLVWIVLLLLLTRIAVWILFFLYSFRINSLIKTKVALNKQAIKSIFHLSFWMMISNIVIPIITYSDRFLIGSILSASFIAYYATPYEVVTKLTVISGALASVLFPTVSANFHNNPLFTFKLSLKAIKFIFIILFPIINTLIIFSKEILNIWLGYDFSINSSLTLKFLSVGVLFNSMAYIPFSFIEGIGRPEVTAKVQVAEMPIYLFLLYLCVYHFGIEGAAFVFALRMIIDFIILFYLMKKIIANRVDIKIKYMSNFNILIVILLASLTLLVINNVALKILATIIVTLSFYIFMWIKVLNSREKDIIISKIRILTKNTLYK